MAYVRNPTSGQMQNATEHKLEKKYAVKLNFNQKL